MASQIKVNEIIKQSGSSITIGESGDTITVPAGTLDNTPAFMGYSDANQTIANDANVHLTIGTEVWDTDNAFASSTFTVPSGKAGKYFFGGQCRISSLGDAKQIQLMIFKNGSSLDRAKTKYLASTGTSMAVTVMLMEDCAVGDNFKLYVYQDNGSQTANSGHTTFYGYRLLGV